MLEQNDGMRAAAVEMQVKDLWKSRRKLVRDVQAAKGDIETLAEDNAKLIKKLSGVTYTLETQPEHANQR